MDTLNPLWGLAGPVGGVVGGVLLWLSARRNQDKTGEAGFRGDLLKRIDQLEASAKDDEESIKTLRARNDELWTENRSLRDEVGKCTTENRQLRDEVSTLTKRLEVIEGR